MADLPLAAHRARPNPSPRARGWATAGVAVVLLVAAWGVSAITPSDDDAVVPFAVSATLGERAEGRNIAVTFHSIEAAESVTAEGWGEEGDTVWVVLDVTAETVVDDVPSILDHVVLNVGGRTYRATERIPDTMLESDLQTAVPTRGGLAFELPADALAGPADIDLALRTDTRLDSLIRLHVDDLGELPLEPTLDVAAEEWGRP